MGSRGPAAKPHALRVLEGRTGSRYHEPKGQRPKPTPTAPVKPAWFDEEASACWDRIVPELERLGLVTLVDHDMLVGYCLAWSAIVAWSKQPAAARDKGARSAQNWFKLLKVFAAEFGLSPASRARLTIPAKDQKTDLDALLDE